MKIDRKQAEQGERPVPPPESGRAAELALRKDEDLRFDREGSDETDSIDQKFGAPPDGLHQLFP